MLLTNEGNTFPSYCHRRRCTYTAILLLFDFSFNRGLSNKGPRNFPKDNYVCDIAYYETALLEFVVTVLTKDGRTSTGHYYEYRYMSLYRRHHALLAVCPIQNKGEDELENK